MAKKVTKANIRKTAANAGRGGISKATEALAVYGVEPTPVKPDSPMYDAYMLKYLNWSNAVFESNDLKEYFMTYAKNKKINTDGFGSLAAGFFSTSGKIAYLINQGREVHTKLLTKLESEIESIRATVKRRTEEERRFAPSPVDEELKTPKHLEEYWNIYTSIDALIDAGKVKDGDVIQIFNKFQPSVRAAKMVQEHYTEDLVVWSESKGDRKYNKIIKDNKTIYEQICSQINTFVVNLENTKAAVRRKPRAKKAKPANKLVEKLPYMKADPKMGITSIPPESIIGAQTLLVFNSKTRKFGIIKAEANKGGFSVKGATIINIDESKSICKTVRKPEEMLSKLTGSTITRTEKLFKDIKAVETKQKGRMSTDILLLKVFK